MDQRLRRAGRLRIEANWADVAFLVAIMLWSGWFYLDSRASSTQFENLILVGPTAFALLALGLWMLTRMVRVTRAPAYAPNSEPVPPWRSRLVAHRTPILFVAVFAGYVGALPFLGFDVGTFCFLLAAQIVIGERRALPLIGFSLAIAILLTYCFKNFLLLPYPTLLL